MLTRNTQISPDLHRASISLFNIRNAKKAKQRLATKDNSSVAPLSGIMTTTHQISGQIIFNYQGIHFKHLDDSYTPIVKCYGGAHYSGNTLLVICHLSSTQEGQEGHKHTHLKTLWGNLSASSIDCLAC